MKFFDKKKNILKKIIVDYINNKGDFEVIKNCKNKDDLRKDLDFIIDEFCEALARTPSVYINFNYYDNFLTTIESKLKNEEIEQIFDCLNEKIK